MKRLLGFFAFIAVSSNTVAAVWQFTGVITSVDPDLVTEIFVGQEFTYSLEFDPSTPDLAIDNGGLRDDTEEAVGRYAAIGFSLSVGDFSAQTPSASDAPSILLTDNSPSTLDRLEISSGLNTHNAPLQGDRELIAVYLHLLDSDGSIFNSDDLPGTLPDLSEFESTQLTLTFSNNWEYPFAFDDKKILGEVTGVAVIPLPATAWLFLSAVGVLIGTRRLA